MTTITIENVPDGAWQLPRRDLLKCLLGGATAVAAPLLLGPGTPVPSLARAAADLAAGNSSDERFWRVVQAQFPLRPGLAVMNAANLCPAPFPVIETVVGLTRDVDGDASFQNRAKFDGLAAASRRALAAYLGARPEEIAILRNTSEANNAVGNGLDLKPPDEVVLWDQNHPTNNVAWEVRARRHGFTVKRVHTPAQPHTPDDLIQPFREALTKHTKVLALTHVSNISGVALPVKELCRLARERGVRTLVDGAQTFGAMQVNLHDLGCDFYTGSAHKWLMGPKEAGVLFVRRERAAELWPSVIGPGWEGAQHQGARKFETLGQRDDAAVAAVAKAVEFHRTLGPARVEARLRELATTLKREIRKIPGAKLHTPLEPELSLGVVVFALPNVEARKAFQALYTQHQIAGAAMGGEFTGVRLCPHVYNPMADVERAVAAVADLAKRGIR
jgi:selenocysteine lyase/cysteine desulfurase